VFAVPQSNIFTRETLSGGLRKHPATNWRYSHACIEGSVSTTHAMMLHRLVHAIPISVRRLMKPRYRPERYYMRGYGPACAAREALSR
jgi:hypothetical protein